jgi:hypothetical protein
MACWSASVADLLTSLLDSFREGAKLTDESIRRFKIRGGGHVPFREPASHGRSAHAPKSNRMTLRQPNVRKSSFADANGVIKARVARPHPQHRATAQNTLASVAGRGIKQEPAVNGANACLLKSLKDRPHRLLPGPAVPYFKAAQGIEVDARAPSALCLRPAE